MKTPEFDSPEWREKRGLMDVQTDNRPIIVRADIDKVHEEEMAALTGTTLKALQRKRARGVIPKGVYATIDGRVMYSIRRYDQWVESLWPDYQLVLSSSVTPAGWSHVPIGTSWQNSTQKPSKTSRPRCAFWGRLVQNWYSKKTTPSGTRMESSPVTLEKHYTAMWGGYQRG